MARKTSDLIDGYLDDDLTADELLELGNWLKADPQNARQFAACVMLHDRLHDELISAAGGEAEDEPVSQPELARTSDFESRGTVASGPSPYTLKSFSTRALIVTAVCLLIAAVTFFRSTKQSPVAANPVPSDTFATITQTIDATWAAKTSLKRGDRISAGPLHLQTGFARLMFDDGVEVTLQGPAKYELSDLGTTRLNTGILTATVPNGAEGFRVDTPSAEVVDLGTAFGVSYSEDGICSISVFDGEVEVGLPLSSSRQRLGEGKAVRVNAENAGIEDIDFETTSFEKMWPIFYRVVQSTGAFHIAPPWPRRIRYVQSDEHIFVIPEGYPVTLQEPLQVNITDAGEYTSEAMLTAGEIPAGQRVRGFMLHYDPETQIIPRRTQRISGVITFERPVLGLIVLYEQLAASAETFAGRRAGELLPRRQLELSDERLGDTITLSEDRRSVSLSLASPGNSSDLVRVLLDASQRTGRFENQANKTRLFVSE